MLISRTSQYAVQSLIYIAAQDQAAPILSREMAERLQVPAAYLAKIMQALCKGGLVTSYRGRLGGFCLSNDAGEIDLMRILLITEGPEFTKGCLLGLKECSDAAACPVHDKWHPIKQDVIAMLKEQTLAMLSEAVRTGQYRLSDIPHVLMPANSIPIRAAC